MALGLSLALRGDLAAFLRTDAKAAAGAVTTVVRRKTTLLKNRLRRQVKSAGLGTRLGNAIRSRTVPPRGVSPTIVGIVESKALVKRKSGIVDLITVFDTGATVAAGVVALLIGGRLARKGGTRFARAQTVRVPKLLDVDGAYAATVHDIDVQVVNEWDRRVDRAAPRSLVA
jgi:hypothetical protein